MKEQWRRLLWMWGIRVSVWVPSVGFGQVQERMRPYKDAELKTTVLLCKSDQNAAGGFWRNLSKQTGDEGVMSGRQSTATTWRITIQRNRAEVIRFSGASQTIEEPEIYNFEETTGGFLLTYQKQSPGESSQVITIDPLTSSFVYSTHHVNIMWNRASIFYGSCQPYR